MKFRYIFKILYDKWVKGHCKRLCFSCQYKYECLPSFIDELEKNKE